MCFEYRDLKRLSKTHGNSEFVLIPQKIKSDAIIDKIWD